MSEGPEFKRSGIRQAIWVALNAVNLIKAELRKQSGDLVRDQNRTARAVPL